MKTLSSKFIYLLISLSLFATELFAHKTGFKHNHGNGNGGVPEIDANEISLIISILVAAYLMYFYWRRKQSQPA